ncbi:AI-2E family transporter [Acuticoccus kandeliae]|uniref:AI-2E family transporter n=1 Tax=Acuticoccus kandeliae TaxID=2073160 RepID=UPI000D3E6417|nr:AI-2E family transporter [Acuticoccus kandeliae]
MHDLSRKPQAERQLFGTSSRISVAPSLTVARWLLLLILAAGVYFFHGFVVPVLAALVIAFATWPLYRRLRAATGERKSLAATLALLSILLFIVVPVALAGVYAIGEVRVWWFWVMEVNRTGATTPHWIATLPLVGDWLNTAWTEKLSHPGGVGELIQLVSGANVGSIYRSVLAAGGSLFGLVLAALFMLITLFCIYRDGESFAAQVDRLGERILPMRWGRLSRTVPATISATVTGMTLIAIGEGIVLGIAYWLAGVPSPVTFGAITAVMALVPGGAPLTFTLISIYLVSSGSEIAGIALFMWGTIELFIVDKTLRPHLVGGPIKLPFLPTFFGLIGGVKTMGVLGLFLGPVLMALLVAIWREWVREAEFGTPGPETPALPEAAPAPPPAPVKTTESAF